MVKNDIHNHIAIVNQGDLFNIDHAKDLIELKSYSLLLYRR